MARRQIFEKRIVIFGIAKKRMGAKIDLPTNGRRVDFYAEKQKIRRNIRVDKAAEHYHYTKYPKARQWGKDKFSALHRIDDVNFV
jgi:hypothetical protein